MKTILLFVLLGTAELLHTVLALLSLLSGLLHCFSKAVSDEAVLRLELLGAFDVVVDQAKASGFAATKLGLKAENKHAVVVLDIIHLGKLLSELFLGDVGTTRVQNINNLQKLKM